MLCVNVVRVVVCPALWSQVFVVLNNRAAGFLDADLLCELVEQRRQGAGLGPTATSAAGRIGVRRVEYEGDRFQAVHSLCAVVARLGRLVTPEHR